MTIFKKRIPTAFALGLLVPVLLAPNAAAQTAGDRAPLTAVNPSYNLINMMPGGIQPVVSGMDFMSNGSLVLCTWGGNYNQMVPPSKKGDLYLVTGIDKGDQTQMTAKKIFTGLQEPLGLKVVHDTIYLSERQALAAVFDKNGNGTIEADEYWKVAPYTDGAERHEFFFGLVYKDGYLYGAHSLNLIAGGTAAQPQADANRGTYLKIDPKTGKTEYISGGAREPFGMTLLPSGDILGTETQGGWNPFCALTFIKPGRFYGHPLQGQSPASPFDAMPYQSPALMLTQPEIANVPGEPAYVPDGPFKGQILYGDVTYGGIQRAFFEKVGGEYQAGVVRFSAGFPGGIGRLKFAPNGDLIVGMTGDPNGGNWHQVDKSQVWGLQKMVANGKANFEILRVLSRPKGMEIEFTDQVGPSGDQAANYIAETWTYKRTSSYGGTHQNTKNLSVSNVQVDAGRKKVYLEMSGLTAKEWVVHIRMPSVKSASGAALWSPETWYTLNAIGTGEPFSAVPYDPFASTTALKPGQAAAAEISMVRLPGAMALRVTVPGAYEVKVFDIRGAVVARFQGPVAGSFDLPVAKLAPGTYTAAVRSGASVASRTFFAW
jgi:hypothetical protein